MRRGFGFKERLAQHSAAGHAKEFVLEVPKRQDSPLAGSEARFHRFQVGRIACTALSDGGIAAQRPPASAAAGTPAAAGQPAAPNAAPEFFLVPLSCLLAELPEGGPKVLFDGGFGATPETLSKPMPSAGRLLESLGGAGIQADDVDLVLISHFDIDHVAGLYDTDGAQVFAKATYYASAEAVDFWSHEEIDLSASPTLPWVKQERLIVSAHVLKAGGERLKTFHAGEEVAPGITTIDLPGHAPGQIGFVIASDGETLVYTADAITNPVFSLETPEVHNIMDLDPVTAVRTRKKLLASMADGGWGSFSPHFPFPAWGRAEKQGEKHVWKPGK